MGEQAGGTINPVYGLTEGVVRGPYDGGPGSAPAQGAPVGIMGEQAGGPINPAGASGAPAGPFNADAYAQTHGYRKTADGWYVGPPDPWGMPRASMTAADLAQMAAVGVRRPYSAGDAYSNAVTLNPAMQQAQEAQRQLQANPQFQALQTQLNQAQASGDMATFARLKTQYDAMTAPVRQLGQAANQALQQDPRLQQLRQQAQAEAQRRDNLSGAFGLTPQPVVRRIPSGENDTSGDQPATPAAKSSGVDLGALSSLAGSALGGQMPSDPMQAQRVIQSWLTNQQAVPAMVRADSAKILQAQQALAGYQQHNTWAAQAAKVPAAYTPVTGPDDTMQGPQSTIAREGAQARNEAASNAASSQNTQADNSQGGESPATPSAPPLGTPGGADHYATVHSPDGTITHQFNSLPSAGYPAAYGANALSSVWGNRPATAAAPAAAARSSSSAVAPSPGSAQFGLSGELARYTSGGQVPQFGSVDTPGRMTSVDQLRSGGWNARWTPQAYRSLSASGRTELGAINRAVSGQRPEELTDSVNRQLPSGPSMMPAAYGS